VKEDEGAKLLIRFRGSRSFLSDARTLATSAFLSALPNAAWRICTIYRGSKFAVEGLEGAFPCVTLPGFVDFATCSEKTASERRRPVCSRIEYRIPSRI